MVRKGETEKAKLTTISQGSKADRCGGKDQNQRSARQTRGYPSGAPKREDRAR